MSKTTSSPPSGGAKGGAANTGLGLSRTMEMMMDKICPMNLAQSEGLGTDNMTGILIEFNKDVGTL